MKLDIPLVLFAKAPIAGQVKTRLTSHCTDKQAAKIAEILLNESLALAVEYWPGKVYLSIWQSNQHPFIVTMIDKFGIELLMQSEGDLGVKMQATFEYLDCPAAIMGCDAPLVTAEALKLAHAKLAEGQNVIGPSEDGGYYLIGLSEPSPAIFKGVSWGEETVLSETVIKAKKTGLDLFELPQSFDIDHWLDVIRASKMLPALAAYIKSMD